jgi:hypothetical protein
MLRRRWRGERTQSMSPSGGTEDLQFQKAEFSGRTCVVCKSVIGDKYYQIQGRDACATCAEARVHARYLGDSGSKTIRALLWGSGAAILGSAAFAAVAFMGAWLAILSIGIGWLVGTAIKKGTEGHTSRKYQVMAVLLTYMAIATSYIPLVIVQMAKTRAKNSAKAAGVAATATAPLPDSTPKPRAPGSGGPALGQAAASIVTLAALAIALPLLVAFRTMPSGLITLLIIFFGLQQAWKQTAPDDALVLGPYPNTPS